MEQIYFRCCQHCNQQDHFHRHGGQDLHTDPCFDCPASEIQRVMLA